MNAGMTTIRLLFGGDFAPSGAYEDLIAIKGSAIFGSARELIEQADFTMFNLEVPLCRGGAAIPKIGPAIRAAPENLRALEEAGVDAVCLANNHIFDYGASGLSETIAALQTRGIGYSGAGFDRSSAEAPLRITVRGRRISLFAYAEREFNLSDDGQAGAAILDPLRVVPQVLRERDQADAVIVCIHAGNEYFSYPRPGLRALCHLLLDIGTDAVIGHHPHVPGPYEIYNGKPIIYSLGNLIFDTPQVPPPEWDEGYLATLNLDFDDSSLTSLRVELFPYRQAAAHGGVLMMLEQEREAFLDRIDEMRDRLENRPSEWHAAWEAFVAQRQTQTFIDMSSPLRFRGLRRLMSWRFLRNLISPPTRQMQRLNMLRCPSHEELTIHALERQIAANCAPRNGKI